MRWCGALLRVYGITTPPLSLLLPHYYHFTTHSQHHSAKIITFATAYHLAPPNI